MKLETMDPWIAAPIFFAGVLFARLSAPTTYVEYTIVTPCSCVLNAENGRLRGGNADLHTEVDALRINENFLVDVGLPRNDWADFQPWCLPIGRPALYGLRHDCLLPRLTLDLDALQQRSDMCLKHTNATTSVP